MADDVDVEAVRRQVAQAFQQIANDLEGLNRRAKDVTSSSGGLGRLDAAFSGITRGLLGTAGLAAGLYQVVKGLENVAIAGVQMQHLARDSGYAVKSVSEIQGAMRMMGASAQEANRTVGNLGEKMQSLAVFREGSPIWQGMAKFPDKGGEIANTLMKIAQEGMRTGDQIGATTRMLELFNKQSPGTKFAWAQVWGESVSHLENLGRKLQVMRDLAIPQFDRGASERYLEQLVAWELRVEYIWNAVAAHTMDGLEKISNAFGVEGKTLETVVGSVNSFVDGGLKILSQDIKDIIAIIDAFKKAQEWWESVKFNAASATGNELSDKYDPNHRRWNVEDIPGLFPKPTYPMVDPMAEHGKGISMVGRFQGWWWGNQWYQGRGQDDHKGITDFGGMRRTQDIQEDNNVLLRDVRDILQRMETKEDTLTNSSGGQGGTGGRRGLAQRLGMDSTTNAGGTPGVSGATRIGKGDDPRGLADYIRETAKKYGVDPETALAVAKSEGLRGFSGDNGTSFGAFQLHVGGGLGDQFRKETGLDPSDPANEKATIDWALKNVNRTGWGPYHGARNTGIGPRAGLGLYGSGVGSSPFGGRVLERQGSVAGVRKGAIDPRLRTAFDYASSKTGLTVDVTSGGQRMPGAEGAIGSHRHDSGRAADFNLRDADGKIVGPNDPRALEFYRYAAQAGVTGGGEGYMSDPNKIHLDVDTDKMGAPVYAGSQAFRESIERGRTEQRMFEEAARARMDQQAGGKTNWGGINAKVEFLNVPNGVKTSAETDGDVFRDIQINRTKQSGVYNNATAGYE